MSGKVVTMEVEGRKIDLLYSTFALIKIEEECGDIRNLTSWMLPKKGKDGGYDTSLTFERISKVLTILANAVIQKNNADISLGLVSGEKKKFLPDDYFISVLTISELSKCQGLIMEAIRRGNGMPEIPENLKVEEKDQDLEDILDEKNQKGV